MRQILGLQLSSWELLEGIIQVVLYFQAVLYFVVLVAILFDVQYYPSSHFITFHREPASFQWINKLTIVKTVIILIGYGWIYYYCDVPCPSRRLKSPVTHRFFRQLIQANNKWKMNGAHRWPIVRGTYRWPLDSLHKGPVMWKLFHVIPLLITSLLFRMPYCYKRKTGRDIFGIFGAAVSNGCGTCG